MDLSYIREKWLNRAGGSVADSISAWDSVAEEYAYDGKIAIEDDAFLKFMTRAVTLEEDMEVLDIGCGAGAYTVAVAPYVKRAVGVDFSPKMIAVAKRSAEASGISNVLFLERDWAACPTEEFRGGYDVVFAHTTPAVSDYATLVKMIGASRRYCFFCKPARRTDEVFDVVREIAGLAGSGHDDSVAYTFDVVWGLGFDPEVSYQKAVWKNSRELPEAEAWYLGRLKGSGTVSEAAATEICRYLERISRDGIVTETIHTTLVNMFWEVNG